MNYEVGEKYLITTDEWFVAPDGGTYKAVFGTLHGISSDEQLLGMATNRHSTNWYVLVGSMILAGCQIHYVIKTDSVSSRAPKRDIEHQGKLSSAAEAYSRIFMADQQADEL